VLTDKIKQVSEEGGHDLFVCRCCAGTYLRKGLRRTILIPDRTFNTLTENETFHSPITVAHFNKKYPTRVTSLDGLSWYYRMAKGTYRVCFGLRRIYVYRLVYKPAAVLFLFAGSS
jgi:hypothetical protein